jgi:hypothetical protein
MTETRNEDLSRAEREALDALPREANPGELLEERTVKALREEGLLAAGAAPVGQAPSREAAVPRPWWQLVAAIAASIALFAGGVSVGQVLGARQTADAFQTVFEDGDALLAAQVQRTGSDYVAALAALAETNGAVADSSQAREVALTALWAAANEIVRLAPDDVLTARILQGFEAQARAQAQESSDYGAESQLLVEF